MGATPPSEPRQPHSPGHPVCLLAPSSLTSGCPVAFSSPNPSPVLLKGGESARAVGLWAPEDHPPQSCGRPYIPQALLAWNWSLPVSSDSQVQDTAVSSRIREWPSPWGPGGPRAETSPCSQRWPRGGQAGGQQKGCGRRRGNQPGTRPSHLLQENLLSLGQAQGLLPAHRPRGTRTGRLQASEEGRGHEAGIRPSPSSLALKSSAVAQRRPRLQVPPARASCREAAAFSPPAS